jgi:hypothetical protein
VPLRKISLAITLFAAWAISSGAHAAAQFETRSSLKANGYTASFVVGDFDRDGALDLATVIAQPGAGGVAIYLGNGDGTFRAGASYSVGAFPHFGAAASFRNNGILDLVISDKLNNAVWVMLGNGDGTFQPAVAYPTTAESFTVAVGDFNGDGKIDIIALEETSTSGKLCECVEVLLGKGDGTFGTPIRTALPDKLAGYAIATGDFNNDGKLDVAVSGETFPAYNAVILLGNGAGGFTVDGNYIVSNVPDAIATGYFTASKDKLDLAVANEEGGSFSVLLGYGNGKFEQPVNYPAFECDWVLAEDFDGDGRVDLAVSDSGPPPQQISGVSIFKGNGDGTFQAGVLYPATVGFLAAGDFNGDGKIDIVGLYGLKGSIITLLNTGVVSFSPTTPLDFRNQTVGTTSPPLAVTLTNTGSTDLKITSMTASAEFAVKSSCGAAVAPSANCTITATFTPTQQGTVQGTIAIIDGASSKPQVIELSGTGS